MRLKLNKTLRAALIAAIAAVSSTAYSGTIGETVTPYTLPQNGGTVHQWTGGAGTTDSQSDANWTNGKPARSSDMGPVLVFDGANVTLTNVNGSIDTSDSGGIKVINNSIVTANSLLGRWAGSVYVEEGSELTTSYSTKLKNTEAATAANIYVDGTFNLTGSANMNISDGNKYENWHIGENGIINITNSNGSVTKASGGSWNFEFVVNNTKSYEKEIIGRELSDSVKVSKTVLTSNNAIALSNVDTYRIINTSNVLLGDETTTGQENAAKLRLDGKNWVVDYTMKGYTAATLTWNGGNNGAWEDLDTGWTLNGETATFISDNGDSVVFGSAGGKDVAINSAIVVKGVTVDEPGYTFNVTGGSLAAQTVTLNSNLSINGAGTATIGTLALNNGAGLALGAGTVLKGTAATLMGQKVTGDGAILLDSNLTLSNGTTTQATAGLIVKGATLTIGGGESQSVNISSLSHIVLDGGTILYAANASSAINGLTVESGKTGTVRIDDITEQNLVFAGTTKIDGTLNLSNNWNSQFKFNKLVGAGTLSTVKGGNQWMTLTIDSLSDGDLKFTGDISYAHNHGDAKDKVIINTGSQEVSFRSLSLDINTGHTMQFNLGADTTIGQMTLTSGTLALAGADTHTLTLGGLDGGATITGLNNLVLNVAGGTHEYTGTFAVAGQITKTGAGSQTITGTALHHTILAQGGTLVLNGTYDIKDIAEGEHQTVYVDASDQVNENGGFQKNEGKLTVYSVNTEAGANLVDTNAVFTYNGVNVTSDVVNGEYTLPGAPDMSALYVKKGNLAFAAYKAKAGENLTTVSLADGTAIDMNEAASINLVMENGANATVNATAATTISGVTGLEAAEKLIIKGSETVTLGAALGSGKVEVDGGTLALGNAAHLLNSLTVKNGGTAITTHDGSNGAVLGTIEISNGGTFRVASGHDAFGWGGDTSTQKIILAGTEQTKAVLDLQGDNKTTTMVSAIEMNGHAAIQHKAEKAAFNTFGCSITANSTDNTIDRMQLRNNVTVTVNADSTLEIGQMTRHSEGSKVFTKAGDGALTFTGEAHMNGFVQQGGSTIFEGVLEIVDDATINAGSVEIGGVSTIGNLAGTGDLVVKEGGSLNVTGTVTNSNITVEDGGTIAGGVDAKNVGIEAGATATFAQGVSDEAHGVTFENEEDSAVAIKNTGTAPLHYDATATDAKVTADILVVESETDVTVKNEVVVGDIANIGEGDLTLTHVDVIKPLKGVYAHDGALTLQNITEVSVVEMEIASGSTVAVYKGDVADATQEGTVTITDKLEAGGGTLLANLEMANGSKLALSLVDGGGRQALTLGSQFTIAKGALVRLDDATLEAIAGLTEGQEVILIKALQENGHELTSNLQNGALASLYFNGVDAADYTMVVNANEIAIKKAGAIPEPTTGTLSLLALMALAARRRRK